jgi:hypothetical protein
VSTLTDPHAPHAAGIVLSRLVIISFLRNALQILSALNGCLKNVSVEFHVFSSVLQKNWNIIFVIHDGVTLKFDRRNITSEEHKTLFNNFRNKTYWRVRSGVAFSE